MKNENDIVTEEEKNIIEVIKAARTIQEFLWGGMNEKADVEEFKRMFRKRVCKIELIETSNPYWRIEMRKRLLQTAAIAVNCITKLDNDSLPKDNPNLVSNLSEFKDLKRDDSEYFTPFCWYVYDPGADDNIGDNKIVWCDEDPALYLPGFKSFKLYKKGEL